MAFVLVQHLDPHHKSLLVELLGAQSPIPVVAADVGRRAIRPDAHDKHLFAILERKIALDDGAVALDGYHIGLDGRVVEVVSEGVCRKKLLNAAKPPADAPMPTMRDGGSLMPLSQDLRDGVRLPSGRFDCQPL
jgi:hypothetical protein